MWVHGHVHVHIYVHTHGVEPSGLARYLAALDVGLLPAEVLTPAERHIHNEQVALISRRPCICLAVAIAEVVETLLTGADVAPVPMELSKAAKIAISACSQSHHFVHIACYRVVSVEHDIISHTWQTASLSRARQPHSTRSAWQ